MATVSELLDDELTEVTEIDELSPATCRFRSQRWWLSISSIPDWTGPLPGGQGQRPQGEADPRVDAPNSTVIQTTRGGDHEAMAAITVGDQHWMVMMHNGARGADTYPPADGPAQYPITQDRLSEVLQHLASQQPPT